MPHQVIHEAVMCCDGSASDGALTNDNTDEGKYYGDGGHDEKIKLNCLTHLMRSEKAVWDAAGVNDSFQAIIFASTEEQASKIHSFLVAMGEFASSVLLTEEMGLEERASALGSFRSAVAGSGYVLVCSGLLARGIDVPSTTHVFHYKLPNTPEAYLHR
jgi:superfamily II DNA/RNA helicase